MVLGLFRRQLGMEALPPGIKPRPSADAGPEPNASADDPGTDDPGTHDPSTHDPGAHHPGAHDTSTHDPGTVSAVRKLLKLV